MKTFAWCEMPNGTIAHPEARDAQLGFLEEMRAVSATLDACVHNATATDALQALLTRMGTEVASWNEVG